MTQELHQNLETTSNPSSNDSRTPLEFDLETSKFEFPLSKVRAGKLLGISDRTVGNWLKKLEEIHQPIGNAALMTNPKGQITEWGFHCLQRFQLEKEDEYRDRVWREAGVESPTEPKGALAVVDTSNESTLELPPLELPEIEWVDAEVLPDAFILDTKHLQGEVEKSDSNGQQFFSVTRARYSRSRTIRRHQIVAQAVRDAAEDACLYHQAYDAKISKTFNEQAEGLEARHQGED